MKPTQKKDIGRIFAEGTLIEEALRAAVREALARHKQARNPVAVWRDGQLIWIPPEDIPTADQAQEPSDRPGPDTGPERPQRTDKGERRPGPSPSTQEEL